MNIALSQVILTSLLAIAIPHSVLSNVLPKSIVQLATSQDSTLLIATAYTDQTLPTLSFGSRGEDVEQLQQILLDNGL